eukprot:TRINITY_DN25681_c0_g1_i1.p1 TRINITY_DN25681_c0_g1~~TRINITY_DN25681_c0_g1_i1.p1  ORF type:complete len:443 (-),score=73.58 TRINITY_DN25681_c0_g1_i1:86-1378(-)
MAEDSELAKMKAETKEINARVKEVFQRFDRDGGGNLDQAELFKVLRTLAPSFLPEEIEKLAKELDSSGDGSVTPTEFIAWLKHGGEWADEIKRVIARESGPKREERIKDAFSKYDATGDGKLDVEELRYTLKLLGSFSNDEVKNVCKDLDKDGDGQISYKEFRWWVKDGTGSREIQKAKSILAPSDNDGLEAVFYNFCGAGKADLDGKSFMKICKDCGLLDKNLTEINVDLIFSDNRVKNKGARTIGFDQFETALELVAVKKGVSRHEVAGSVLEHGAPRVVGTKTDNAPSFDKGARRTAPARKKKPKPKSVLSETAGEELWKRETNNQELWRVFGLDSDAGRVLKRIYNPHYVPSSSPKAGKKRGAGPSSPTAYPGDASDPVVAAARDAHTFLTKSVSLPAIRGATPKTDSKTQAGLGLAVSSSSISMV